MSKRRRRQPAFFTGAFPSTPPPREGPFPTMPASDYSDPTMKFGKSGYGIRMVSAPKRGADPASQPAFYDESFTPDTVPTPAPRPPMSAPGLALAPAAAPQMPPPSPQGASVAALAPHVPAMVAQNPGMLPDPGRQRGVTFATQGMMGKGVWNRDTYDRFTQNMQPGDAAALGTPLRSDPNASAPVYSEQMQGIAPNATPEQARRLLGLRSGVLTTNKAGQDFLARQRGRAGDVNNPARMMQSVARRRDAMAESDKDRAMAVQGAQIAANQPQMIAGPDGQPVAVVAGGKMGIVPRPKEADAGTMTAEYDGQGNLVKQTQRTPVDPNAPVSVFDAFGQRDPELRSIQSQIDSDSKALAKGDKRSGPDWAWGAKRKERIAKNRAKLQAAVIRRMAPNISDDQLAKAQAYIANAEADGQIVTEELLRALLQGLSS